jgi:putative transposase
MRAKTNLSERRACALIGLSRTVLHYVSRPTDDALQRRLIELAGERRRFGYRRLHTLLEREGFEANHKRVHRLYRQAGLAVRRRRKRDRVAVERRPLQVPLGPNHTWSMDFVFDALANRRPIKCLTVVDDCIKEAIEILVAKRINGQGVADALDAVCRFRGYPTTIRTDQGPEFTGRALDQWAHANGVTLMLTQPGK